MVSGEWKKAIIKLRQQWIEIVRNNVQNLFWALFAIFEHIKFMFSTLTTLPILYNIIYSIPISRRFLFRSSHIPIPVAQTLLPKMSCERTTSNRFCFCIWVTTMIKVERSNKLLCFCLNCRDAATAKQCG